MKLLVSLSALTVLQGTLGIITRTDEEFCQHVKLAAEKLHLLITLPSHSPKLYNAAHNLPCYEALDWDSEKVIKTRFTHDRGVEHSLPSSMNPYAHTSEERLNGKMLVVPEHIANHWKACHIYMNMKDHLFGLVGGVVRWNNKLFAFTFDPTTNAAYALKPDGQVEKLIINTTKVVKYVFDIPGLDLTTTMLLNLELQDDDQQQVEDGFLKQKPNSQSPDKVLDEQMDLFGNRESRLQEQQNQPLPHGDASWAQHEELKETEASEKRWQAYPNKRDARQEWNEELEMGPFVFETLFYKAIRPIEKATNFVNVSLDETHLPLAEIEVPKSLGLSESKSLQNYLRYHSTRLIKLLGMIKYFKFAHFKEPADWNRPFKNPQIDAISELIDSFNTKSSKAEKQSFVHDALKLGLQVMTSNDFILSPFDALICRDDEIKDLFLAPKLKPNIFNPFDSSMQLDKMEFDDLAYDQILPYKVVQEIPLSFTLKIAGNQSANFELFALIDANNFLYFIRRLDKKFMAISIHARDAEPREVNLDLELDKDGTPTLQFGGYGLAFYGSCLSHQKEEQEEDDDAETPHLDPL